MAKILVVDDLPANREVIVNLLRYRQHQLLEAANGRDALEIAIAEQPDLVITDVLMPLMDGYALVKAMRLEPRTNSIPVIFYTAHYGAKEARDLALSAGVAFVITKPAEPQAVLETVDQALAGSDRSRRSEPSVLSQEFDQEHLRIVTEKLSVTMDDLRASNTRLRALINIGLELASEHDGRRLLAKVCEASRDLFAASYVTVGIVERGERTVEMIVTAGTDAAAWATVGAAPAPFFNEVIGERRSRVGNNASGDPVDVQLPASHPPIRAYVVAPIVSPSHVYGWICLVGNEGQQFGDDDQQLLLALAGQVGRIYENGYYYTIAMRRAEELQREVVEHTVASNALRMAEERMRFALESAEIGIWDMDYGTGELRWSEILEKHCGIPPGTFAGTFEAFVDYIHPADRQRVLDSVNSATVAGYDFDVEYRTQWPDGTVRWLSSAGRIVSDASGKPLRGIGIALDVTKRHTLEAQYLQAQKMEAVGRLAGGVAHDFNNLLTCILGYSELLLGDMGEADRGRREIQEIQKAGGIAAGLTKQLLAFSRKQIVETKPIDLNAIVSGMQEMVTRLIGEDVTVTFTLAPAVPQIFADRGQIEQVILNLAVNARDAMPDGGHLTIETADVELDEAYAQSHLGAKPGRYVAVTVTDTGVGISEDVRSRLFEPFFTTKEAGKGTGLGLATVHSIVTRFGGSIAIYSEPGKGAAFTIYLPHEGGRTADASATVSAPVQAPPGSYTVLVVDDSKGVRELAMLLLERLGYRALAAANADEAAKVFRDQPAIDVVLTDVVMPGASGPEMTTRLIEEHPALKVIYMSGYTEDAISRRGVLNPGIAFLHKPFTSATLANKVREVLDQRANQ